MKQWWFSCSDYPDYVKGPLSFERAMAKVTLQREKGPCKARHTVSNFDPRKAEQKASDEPAR